ncbi:MAG: M14 family metallopeptidase [Planctomycetota bacterium]|nr:M14 family metallopeptidase [Planctomycetota bacterium]
MKSRVLALCLLLCMSSVAYAQEKSETVQSPKEFLGHKVGADFKLASWSKIVEYFRKLGKNSPRVNTREIGKSTEGRPFLLVEISSAKNLKNRDALIKASRQIADPRKITDKKKLLKDAKVVIGLACSLHSIEVAASQMSLELAHHLATAKDKRTKDILDNCVIVLFPSQNPDGNDKVRDWYLKSLGRPWEGGRLPWLYQKYAGHDNNRDWFMLNLKETRLVTEALYFEWAPTIYYDIHQMGNSGARFFVPPFHDPINPNLDPVVNQTLMIIGGHMSADLLRKKKRGVISGAIYDNWWAGGNRTTPQRHNIVALLTEAASANIASPVFQRKRKLRGGRRGMLDYRPAVNFPDPWPGGWWRLRDIVEYELSAIDSLATLSARYREELLQSQIELGEKQIRLGKAGSSFAWLVPENQRDPERASQMLTILQRAGIEVHRAQKAFSAGGQEYPAGTRILFAGQPFRPHLKDMMERQIYPTRYEYPGGPAEAPYDMAGWTLPIQMGVEYVTIDRPFKADSELLSRLTDPKGITTRTRVGRIEALPRRSLETAKWLATKNQRLRDASFVFRLHKEGVPVFVADAAFEWAGQSFKKGSLIIAGPGAKKGLTEAILGTIGKEYQLELYASQEAIPVAKRRLKPTRIGLYQPFTASMDEGWTRLVFDNFAIPYLTLRNADIRAGAKDLRRKVDVVILPAVVASSILEGVPVDATAPQYAGGLGMEGVSALQRFVEEGGVLIANDRSCGLLIDQFKLPLKNVTRNKKREEFYCAGSIVRVKYDWKHPVAFGMPERGIGFFTKSRAFSLDTAESIKGNKKLSSAQRQLKLRALKDYPTSLVARYANSMVLVSGWIHKPAVIAGQGAITETKYGKGRVILFGFRVQHRAQAQQTFRLLFNSTLRQGLLPEKAGKKD